MEDSMYCSVVDCHLKYPLYQRIIPQGYWWHPDNSKSNYMSGSHNEWKKTAIASSIGQGIYDLGDHNKVTNCIIHDYSLTGAGVTGISAFDAPFGEYTYNTIHDGGDVGMDLWSAFNQRVEHNHIYNINTLSRDSHMMSFGSASDAGETVIAYNHLHDSLDKHDGDGMAVGSGGGIKVHHNLVWNVSQIAIRMREFGLASEVYNNTVFNCRFAFGTRQPFPMVGTFINNIANGPIRSETGDRPWEQYHNGWYSIDLSGWPTSDSGAIDAGALIPGITDGYVGSAPDIGCFEVGTEPWQAGADWVETDFTRIPSTEGFETGDFLEFDWAKSPDWAVTSEDKNSGFYSARCSGLSADERSTLEVYLRCRAGEITFSRKVSSHGAQAGLMFDIDCERRAQWSGDGDWEQVSFPVTEGTHAFTWTYFRNDGFPADNDAAWIDDIEFPIHSEATANEPPVTRISNIEGFETRDFRQFAWCNKSGWAITSEDKNSGFYSAHCSALSAHRGPDLDVFLKCRAGEITFYRKVSSPGARVGLVLHIDGVWTGSEWWGDWDWEQVSFPVTEGIHTFRWICKYRDNSPSDDAVWIDDIEFPIYFGAAAEEPPVTRISNTEGFETGDFIEFDWEFHGDADWTVISEERYSGTYSVHAGSLANDESATLETTLDCIDGNVSFFCKVSSESNWDWLTFYIDGVEQDRWSGEQDWIEASFSVRSGRRTFRWTYSKDESSSDGSDTAWIDDITFPIND